MPANKKPWIGNLTGTASKVNGLKTATSTVDVAGAAAPTAGQVLTATSGTAATWQTPASIASAGELATTTTTVSVDGSAPPETDYILITTNATTATWQSAPQLLTTSRKAFIDDFMTPVGTSEPTGIWEITLGTNNPVDNITTHFAGNHPGQWVLRANNAETSYIRSNYVRLGGGQYEHTWIWLCSHVPIVGTDHRLKLGLTVVHDLTNADTYGVVFRVDRLLGNDHLYATTKAVGAGTITTTSASPNVTGTGTSFTSYAIGDEIRVNATRGFIQSITNDTALVLTANAGTNNTNQSFSISKNTSLGALSATTWYNTKFVVNAALTEVKFYVNGSLAATHTGSVYIPPDTINLRPHAVVATLTGTTERDLVLDYFSDSLLFTTPR
jgi:hypothetical protein